MKVIFWDTETNGLEARHSVLSISAIKLSLAIEGEKIDGDIMERYERFYFRKPGEALGEEAVGVNGLTDDVLRERRNGVDYPENFCDDIEPFRLFCSDTRHFVGHNIYYDKQYINFWLPSMFCTMRSNTDIIGLKRANGNPKYPSLREAARFYGVETDDDQLHGSMYDSLVTYRVFCKMLGNEKGEGRVRAFLGLATLSKK